MIQTEYGKVEGIKKEKMKTIKAIALFLAMTFILAGCANAAPAASEAASTAGAESTEATTSEEATAKKNGEVYILFTSDVHCGIDQGFGYAGLAEIRDNLEAEGYTTILVDDGDYIQGEAIGMLSKGESIVQLMNDLSYDVAIPGNHEFDYGMDQFFKLADMSEFKIISCNFNKDGEFPFDPYTIVEAAGMKIGFVGVTTPHTLTTSTPKVFQDENGNFIYNFLQDDTGEKLYEAVQNAVDGARADGADYVYVMGHLGMNAADQPYTYANVIENVEGIDAFLDGHSHDTEQVVMKDKDSKDVDRSGVGTKMKAIGYSHITPDDGIVKTDIWVWNNTDSMPSLLGIDNYISQRIDEEKAEFNDQLKEVIAKANVQLTISDPVEKDEKGSPIRMVRRAETNAGDFCADAFKYVSGADIGLANGGSVRANIEKGDVTYGDILNIAPFNNQIVMIETSGQSILDSLEYGVKDLPAEFGGFLQVSGLTYEIDPSVPSGCVLDEKGMLMGIEGDRRVRNVMVGDEPIDPDKTYRVAGNQYLLMENGDGNTAFSGSTVVNASVMPDSQALIQYIQDELEGQIGDGYDDPYGQDRIVIDARIQG